MNRKDKINLNKYAQDIIPINEVLESFSIETYDKKQMFLREFIYFFLNQSKPENSDIDESISKSGLRPTYTSCVILKKFGINKASFEKIITLPENEQEKAFRLLFNLFKIAYKRRYATEINNPNKWWYWDLTNSENLKRLEEIEI